MKTFHLYSPIQKLSRGGVKTALLIIFSLAFLLVSSCDIFGPKTGDNEQTQENQQPSSSSQTPSGTDNPNPTDPNPTDPNDSPQLQVTDFAELLSQQEKASIKELSSASLFESVESLAIIFEILNDYAYTNYELMNTGSDYMSIENLYNTIYYNNKDLLIDLRYFNKTLPNIDPDKKEEFPRTYRAAVNSKEEYYKYQAGEYTQIYNKFKPVFTNLSKPNFDKLEQYVANILKDFQDNYKLDRTFSLDELNEHIQAAKEDIEQLSAEELKEFQDAYFRVTVQGYDYALEKINNYENPKILTITLGDEYNYWDIVYEYQKVNIALPPQSEVVDVFESAYYAKKLTETFGDLVDVGFAEYPESVKRIEIDLLHAREKYYDVAKYYYYGPNNMFQDCDDDSVLCGLEHEYGTADNLAMLYWLFYNEELPDPKNGLTFTRPLVPGVDVVFHYCRDFVRFCYDDDGSINKDDEYFRGTFHSNCIQLAYKFTSTKYENVVIMQDSYNLSATYRGGIIGERIRFENYGPQTIITGEVCGFDAFNAVYELFVKDKTAEQLPYSNFEIGLGCDESDFIYDYNSDYPEDSYKPKTNLYGTTYIVEFIKQYIENNVAEKVNLESRKEFNARDYLNGASMYKGNVYKNNAFDLDINVAILMAKSGLSIKNVQISGVRNPDINVNGFCCYLTNAFVYSDMSGTDVMCHAVVDFMDEAPAEISDYDSFVTFTKVSNTVNVSNMGYIDATALSQAQANLIVGPNNYYLIKKLAVTSDVTLPGGDIRQGLFDSIDGFGITKEWVELLCEYEIVNFDGYDGYSIINYDHPLYPVCTIAKESSENINDYESHDFIKNPWMAYKFYLEEGKTYHFKNINLTQNNNNSYYFTIKFIQEYPNEERLSFSLIDSYDFTYTCEGSGVFFYEILACNWLADSGVSLGFYIWEE
ncbi:MAG: hypothetical protein IKR64_00545 [Treponema sp.]|nr:hypothetical protein [Treponema sp.]